MGEIIIIRVIIMIIIIRRRGGGNIIVEIHSVVVSTERRLRFLFGDDEDVARSPPSTLVLSISVSATFFLTGVTSGIISKPGLRA